MIKAICYTNLDDYKREEFPKLFVALPNKGDYVQAESGKTLKVVAITHCFRESATTFPAQPYIKVELHK